MNILFVSLLRFQSFEESNIYTDLLREFIKKGNHVDAISPTERKYEETTQLLCDNTGNTILSLRIGNIQKCNRLEKGLTTISLEKVLIRAIRKYLNNIKYDLILYTTPPITFAKAVSYVKKRDGARTYLLLKDIFPQNAVDLEMMRESSIIYKYFRHKEKKLYAGADTIGCMSKANVEYLLSHNPEIDKEKVEVCPNCIEPKVIAPYNKDACKTKQGFPTDAIVFMYGGNLGKPQNVDFIVKFLKANEGKNDRYFVICGSGTDAIKIEEYVKESQPKNVRYIKGLPKKEYDELLKACDIGMIFLDHRFTIPNFPSRLLSYMEYSMPVVAFTDQNTDIGKVIVENDFGWWEESLDTVKCKEVIDGIVANLNMEKGLKARLYLQENFSAKSCYQNWFAQNGDNKPTC